MDIMRDIFGALPWLVACAFSFYAGQKRRQWVDAPRSSEALKRELALREQLVARYDAFARALGWEYQPASNWRLGGWHPIAREGKCAAASVTAAAPVVVFTTSTESGTVGTQFTSSTTRIYPAASTKTARAGSTDHDKASPLAAKPKRKRARGSSTAGGRK